MAKQTRIPADTIAKLSNAVHRVWQVIGHDLDGCDNAGAVESCIDADRIATYVGPEPQALLQQTISTFGYTVTHKALCRANQLA